VELANLGEGLRRLCELLLAAGAGALYPSLLGGPAVLDADGLRALPAALPRERASLMTVHLFASCPMGEDERRCATDSFGRVHGADGLHVADASLMCSAPGVNPQGTVMALAHRNALRYLERG
jgi:choline dehydrogenase-like flavoprotein